MHVSELQTPALVVDRAVFDRNIAQMAEIRPGPALRPHVKAFKSTALARRLAEAGHAGFCCATPAEVTGMAHAGLGDDLLLANETIEQLLLAHEHVGGDVVSGGGTMDHGNPAITDGDIWIVSDEHVTFAGLDVSVGDRVRLLPAHLDPTVAKHDRMWVLDGDEVVDDWPVDLRRS